MLEVEKLIEVKKGSGVYVIRVPELFPEDFPEEKDNELRDVGPFELLQARQLLESSIAEFAAQQDYQNKIYKYFVTY
ncbi:hypothetical protein EFIBHEMM_03029 [Mannheimia haemolytica]